MRAFAQRAAVDEGRVITAIAHALWVRYHSYEDASEAPDRNLHELVAATQLIGGVELRREGDTLVAEGRIAADAARMLAAALAAPDLPLSRWEYIAPEERTAILDVWNATDARWDARMLVHELFERWVERTPERVAIVHGDHEFTYRQLAERSAGLLAALQAAGVTPGATVGLCIERGVDVVAACLAILQAGAAYVPVDPASPPERIASVLDDADVHVVLASPSLRVALPEPAVRVIDVTTIDVAVPNVPAGERLSPESLAYIIYTSGSTGKPKGVEITHRNVVAFVDWVERRFPAELRSGFVFATSIAFDVSVFEVFGAVCTGGTMLLLENILDLADAPRREMARILSGTASGLGEIVHDRAIPPGVRIVAQAGERLPQKLALEILATTSIDELINLCGATEDTVYSTATVVPRDLAEAPSIGKPFTNRRAYVLDRFGRLCPPGISGELHYAGTGVARGYRKRPELTAARFVANPYSRSREDRRMYKSGDLVRLRPDGDIEYLARIDLQVKIRGIRIELGEIETAMDTHPAIVESVAVARRFGDELRLIAYAVVRRELSLLELREHLGQTLPDAMIPTGFVPVESWPMTPNGKLDRAALPDPAVRSTSQIEPRTPAEEMVARFWAEILHVEPGSDDDFFALGGHSLLAARVVARIRDHARVAISLRDLLRNPKLAAFASVVERAEPLEDRALRAPGPTGVARPLSSMQQHLWFLGELLGRTAAYNVAFDAVLDGEVEVALLARALAVVTARHPELIAAVRVQDEAPWLVPSAAAPTILVDADPEALASEPFDLAVGPLLRLGLRRVAGTTVLTVVVHHLVIDGASIPVFVRELLEAYAAVVAGRPVERNVVAALEDDEPGREARNARQLEFWRARLARDVPPLAFAAGGSDDEHHAGERIVDRIGAEDGARLRRLAALADSTPFVVGLTAWAQALHRRTARARLRIGTPVGSRAADAATTIGYHVNMVTIESDVADAPNFGDALQRLSATAFEAFANADVPYSAVVAAATRQRELSHSPLFNVVFVVQPPRENVRAGALTATIRERFNGTAKFDLLLQLEPEDGGFVVTLEYRKAALDRAEATALLAEFHASLAAAFAEESKAAPAAVTLHGWFDRVVAERPAAIAATDAGGSITYAELQKRAGEVARALVAAGVEPGSIVGVLVERTREMLIAILGVLKAGAAYAPLDPAHPADRLAFILTDAGITTLATHRGMESVLSGFTGKIVDIERPLAPRNIALPERLPHDALAYVIYTSGSTGLPKGVLVEHRNVVRLFTATQALYGFDERDVWTLFHSYAFDFSVWEMYGALLYGGRLVIVPSGATRAPSEFVDLILREGVTVLNQTPSAFALVGDELRSRGDAGRLRHVIFGGEALVPRSLSAWFERFGDERPRLTNMYGITETTVHVTHRRITAADAARDGSPIGEPIDDLRIDLLDEREQPVAEGEAGEIWVSGPGVARGYLNRPDVTSARFRTLRVDGAEQTVYRSGDLARRVAGGLEYVGRIDRQVKIRGYRVELGEVENALLAHPAVSGAVVVTLGDEARRRLGGYVTLREPAESGEIIDFVRARVPKYMVPALLRIVDAFPLTANGKVDYEGLPPFEAGTVLDESSWSETERRIVRIWRALLEFDEIGPDDDFFAVGGHSLLAARMIARVQEDFGTTVSLAAFYVKPTVRALAGAIDERSTAAALVEIGPARDERPTIFWFHGMLTTNGWYVRDLAKNLESGVVMVQPHGFDGVPPPPSIEQMAEERLSEIRKIQPNGPYRIGGFCNGGVLAYHIAARLESMGEKVDQLVLAATSMTYLKYLPLVHAVDWFGKRLGLSRERRIALAGRIQGYLYELELLLIDPERNALYSPKVLLERAKAKQQQRRMRNVALASRERADEGPFMEDYRRAMLVYEPPRYSGPITLVWGRESRVDGWTHPTLGWGPLVDGKVTVHRIPGAHFAVVDHPELLAEIWNGDRAGVALA